MLGRFQPLHKGHLRLIHDPLSTIVVIIQRKKQDKNNPLSLSERVSIVKTCIPGSIVISYKTGYVPDIVKYLIHQNIIQDESQINELLCGPDRVLSYQQQISNKNMKIKIHTTSDKNISATRARLAVRTNNKIEFESLVPPNARVSWSEIKKFDKNCTK